MFEIVQGYPEMRTKVDLDSIDSDDASDGEMVRMKAFAKPRLASAYTG